MKMTVAVDSELGGVLKRAADANRDVSMVVLSGPDRLACVLYEWEISGSDPGSMSAEWMVEYVEARPEGV